MKTKPRLNRIRWLGFLIIPVLLFLTSHFLSDARGPFYLGSNFDPEYAYFMNSLSFSQGMPILHCDHPGTPLQVLGAMILKVDQLLFRRSESTRHILENSEHYLNILQLILVGLISCAIFLLGMTIYSVAGNIWWSWLAQLSIFISAPVAWQGLTKVSPEPLLVSVTIWLVCLFFYTQTKESSSGTSGAMILFGILCALGMASKVNFLPILIIPVLCLRPRRSIVFMLITALFFFIFTLPIVHRYSVFFRWIGAIIHHAGIYGGGKKTFLNPAAYWFNLRNIFSSDIPFTLSVFVSILAVCVSLISPVLHAWAKNNRMINILSISILAQIASVLVVAKHWTPNRIHYLLPGLCLAGFNWVLLGLAARQAEHDLGNALRLKPLKMSLIMIALILFMHTMVETHRSYLNWEKKKVNMLTLAKEVDLKFNDYLKVYYYRSSSRAFALKFGADFSSLKYSEIFKSMFPSVCFYNIWDSKYYNFNKVIPLSELLKINPRILFIGDTDNSKKIKIKVKEILRKGHEAVNLVTE